LSHSSENRASYRDLRTHSSEDLTEFHAYDPGPDNEPGCKKRDKDKGAIMPNGIKVGPSLITNECESRMLVDPV